MLKRLPLLGLLLALLLPAQAPAHPHVWIDAEITLDFRDAKVARIRVTWRFDEFFSDPQGNRHQLPQLAARAADALKEYHYFTILQVGGQRRPVQTVENFTAALERQRLVYRFDIPVAEPFDPAAQEFDLLVFDPTYYVDIALADDRPVGLEGSGRPSACSVTKSIDKSTPLYDGAAYPMLARIKCR